MHGVDRNYYNATEDSSSDDAETKSKMCRNQVRHRVKPLYLFEAGMRATLVYGLRLVGRTMPSVHRLIGLGFMYIYLQVLALLWAFLLNAAFSVALDISSLAARHALDFSLNISLVRAFATFYVVYGTFRVFAKFGGAVGLIAWESLDDFPHACRVATEAAETWPYFISVAFIPQVFLATMLMIAPVLCPSVSASVTDNYNLTDFNMKNLRNFSCNRTPFLYLTMEYPKARHTLKLVLVVGLIQYFQILLHRFPNWRKALVGIPLDADSPLNRDQIEVPRGKWRRTGTSLWVRLGLHFALMGCFTLTVVWALHWLLTALEGETPYWLKIALGPLERDFGLYLVMGWTIWLLIVSIVLCGCAHAPSPSISQHREVFQHLKASFVVSCVMFFCTSLLHPSMGFLDAQRELTVLTIIIPITYVVLYLVVSSAMRWSSWIAMSTAILISAGLSTFLYSYSNFGGPGTIAIMGLHIFGKLMSFFAPIKEAEEEEEEEEDDKGTNQSMTEDNMVANSLISDISSKKLSYRDQNQTDETGLNKDKQIGISPKIISHSLRPFSLRVVSRKFFESPRNLDPQEFGFFATNGSPHQARVGAEGRILMKRSLSMNDVVSSTNDMLSSPSLLPSAASMRPLFLKRPASFLKRSEPESGPNEGKAGRWVSDMWQDSNAQFMYSGTVRLSLAFLFIFFLFLAAFHMLSLMQAQKGWYPSLIKISVNEKKSLIVEHALIAKVILHTTGPSTTKTPRYAACGMQWNGLSLVDYALLAEFSYFDPEDSSYQLQEVLDMIFPPEKIIKQSKSKKKRQRLPLKVIVPSSEYRQGTHAQFVELRSKDSSMSVIAVRGTDIGRLADFIEDIKIWAEPFIFMLLSTLFPTIRIWPDSTASAVIEWLHETLQLFGLQSSTALLYYQPLLEYVKELVNDGREVTLTGHSLGGALARIVGSLAKVPSITFSPPGIAQSYRKFQVAPGESGRAELHHESVAVIPEHDFVPMIDTQVGLVQKVACKSSAKALQGACHMLEVTLCELINHCGDSRGHFTGCEFEYNVANLMSYFIDMLRDRFASWLAPGIALILIVLALFIVPEGI